MSTSIILGVFKGNFREMAEQTNSSSYPFTELIGDKFMEFDNDTIISTVYFAARKAERINFVIDYLVPGIFSTKDSYTCRELSMLLAHPTDEILSKIVFWDEGKVVSNEYVQNKLDLPKELFV